jgi:drug/metabolite transporter (DMT)-like permease
MWFYFALLSALTNAVGTVARKTHGSSARPAEIAWWCQLIMVPCSLALVLLNHHHKLFKNHNFILPTLAASVIYCFSTIFLLIAYKYGQTSVVTPLSNLLPVGLLVASFLMFGTVPPLTGVIGVLLVGGGLYYLSINGKHGLLQPFKAVWSQRGSKAMLLVVLLWVIGTNLDKISLRSASPAFLVLCEQVIGFILLSVYLIARHSRKRERVWKRWWPNITIMSVFTTLAIYFQAKAVALSGNTSYVLAVKRLDVILVVLYSGFVMKEKHVLKRFMGSLIAVAGVAIIYFVS